MDREEVRRGVHWSGELCITTKRRALSRDNVRSECNRPSFPHLSRIGCRRQDHSHTHIHTHTHTHTHTHAQAQAQAQAHTRARTRTRTRTHTHTHTHTHSSERADPVRSTGAGIKMVDGGQTGQHCRLQEGRRVLKPQERREEGREGGGREVPDSCR